MRKRKSEAFAAIKGDLFRARDFHALLAEDFFQAAEEVRHFGGDLRFWRQKASNHAFVPGNLDLLAVMQEFLHKGEAVTEVANGDFLHVAHSSIAIVSKKSEPLDCMASVEVILGRPVRGSDLVKDKQSALHSGNEAALGASEVSIFVKTGNLS